jgi:general secretion pathway protein K
MRPPRPARQQRGAAVLMAIVIATLATVLVASLFWGQFVLLRTVDNQQLLAQNRLLLRGALDWARGVLREDQRANPLRTVLTEPWAQGLAQTRFDQIGETSPLAARASKARFNLRNLVDGSGEPKPEQIAALRKLVAVLGGNAASADLIALRMQQALRPATDGDAAAARPLPLLLPQDLAGIDGIDQATAARLAPYTIVLDESGTTVNVNTAPAEVLAALVPGASLADARAWVAQRERLGYFFDMADFGKYLRTGLTAGSSSLGTSSRYFLVRGQIKLDRAVTQMEALAKRGSDANQPTLLLWEREL